MITYHLPKTSICKKYKLLFVKGSEAVIESTNIVIDLKGN